MKSVLRDEQKPRNVREIELQWIPMRDGTRLAARLFMPEDAEVRPVPAILEYIPYRRRDSTRDGDNLTHPWFAAQGYACVRLDIRGTGDSEGVIRDEYLKQEQDDAVEAIETHNASGNAPKLEMWPESHLERLLAARPALIAEFGLR